MNPQLVIQDFGGKHNEDLAKKDRTRAQHRAWYLLNAERKKASARAYYAANREVRILRAKKYREINPGVWRASHRKRLYGIDNAAVEEMLLRQKSRCAICQNDFGSDKGRKMHIDHDHASGRVRGLLCGKCNVSLGHLEKPGFMDAALKYLGQK